MVVGCMKFSTFFPKKCVVQVEYVAGFLVGVEAGKLLLPSALSILGGLAESIFNIKVGHMWPLLLWAELFDEQTLAS